MTRRVAIEVSERLATALEALGATSLEQRLAFERAIARAVSVEHAAREARHRALVSKQRRAFGWQWYPGNTTGAGGSHG